MAAAHFSLIDLPRTEPIDDPQAYLQAAVRWHFSPQTGSPYWLHRAKTLDFNPLNDVKTFEDLALVSGWRCGEGQLLRPTSVRRCALPNRLARCPRSTIPPVGGAATTSSTVSRRVCSSSATPCAASTRSGAKA